MSSSKATDTCPVCKGSQLEIGFVGHGGTPTATTCSACEGTGKLPETKKE